MTVRVDLHVHSRFSDRADEWFLRAVAAPESFTEPREIHRLCRARGMRFVTVSDHDSIEGALAIADLPGTFLSSEVTVAFPEDGCQVHCLVAGVSEEQHHEVQRLKGDVYAFRDYTAAEGIVCSVAHPFYRVNDLLTVDHLERLLLLFDRFEARNGIHDGGGNGLVESVFSRLTPEDVAAMAERQELAPRGERPWRKSFTGGSDDHGGLYVATTWTETPEVGSVDAFLDHLRAGRSAAGGEGGSSHRLAQSLYAIADGYCERRLGASRDPFRATLRRLGLPEAPSRVRRFLLGAPAAAAPPPSRDHTLSRAEAAFARGVRRFLFGARRTLAHGDLAAGLESLAHLAPAAAALVPYLFAFNAQHKDAELLRRARRRFGAAGGGAKAWAADTSGDVDGAARTVTSIAAAAARQGRDLTVYTCGKRPPAADGLQVVNLRPLARLPLPRRPHERSPEIVLGVPPFLALVDDLERRGIEEVVVSTPGPVGLAAAAAARLLGARLSGVFHTDLPSYARALTAAPDAEELAWGAMRWFYGGMDRVWARSEAERDLLLERGLDADRLAVMPRGVGNGLQAAAEGFVDLLWREDEEAVAPARPAAVRGSVAAAEAEPLVRAG